MLKTAFVVEMNAVCGLSIHESILEKCNRLHRNIKQTLKTMSNDAENTALSSQNKLQIKKILTQTIEKK